MKAFPFDRFFQFFDRPILGVALSDDTVFETESGLGVEGLAEDDRVKVHRSPNRMTFLL